MISARHHLMYLVALAALAAACSTGPAGTFETQTSPAAQAPSPASSEPTKTTTQAREEWRRAMSRAPLPKKGCFQVSHPSTEWVEVPCGVAPKDPILPSTGLPGAHVGAGIDSSSPRSEQKSAGVSPETVGASSSDWAAEVPQPGLLLTAEGSFPSVIGLTSETDGTPDDYSLQLNTNPINGSVGSWAALCKGAKQPFACHEYHRPRNGRAAVHFAAAWCGRPHRRQDAQRPQGTRCRNAPTAAANAPNAETPSGSSVHRRAASSDA